MHGKNKKTNRYGALSIIVLNIMRCQQNTENTTNMVTPRDEPRLQRLRELPSVVT